MPRIMIDDPTRTNPLALINVAKMGAIGDAVTPNPQYLQATGDNQLTMIDNCVFVVGTNGIFQTQITTLGTGNLDTGTAFIPGNDYYVYICDMGGANNETYRISLNSTFPAGFSDLTSRKIGGFHVGIARRIDSSLRPVNASNGVYGAGWEGNIYTGIVPRSVWTLQHRPKCAPEGMVYVGAGVWVDIYLSSDDGNGGLRSANNAIPLSGTEGHNWLSFTDRANVVGKRLLTYSEFVRAAYGSPQGNDGDNVNAWSMTTNTGRNPTGQVINAVSSIGTRDMVGNLWEWLNDIMVNPCATVLMGTTGPTPYTYASYDGGRAGQTTNTGTGHGPTTRAYNSTAAPVAGAWNWDTISPLGDTTGGNPNNGNVWQYYDWSMTALLGGGYWDYGSRAGCRTLHAANSGLWHVTAYYGARCACESL